MTYRVTEIFYTLQGEGANAGKPAVFVRFAGCNLWSGRDATRARDALRNGVDCPLWCDTDFRRGVPMTSSEIASAVAAHAGVPLIVLTGGEPLLQVDRELCTVLRATAPQAMLAVETNGTVLPQVPIGTVTGIDWVCVSPKRSAADLKLRAGSELKVVFPDYDPMAYAEIALAFDHLFVSPRAPIERVGVSVVSADVMQRAAQWVMDHPRWRLSLQTHKLLSIP